MEAHVFAVWDCMSLLKRLQPRPSPVIEVPVEPPRGPLVGRAIDQSGRASGEENRYRAPMEKPSVISSFYLGAMREVGTNTASFELFPDPPSQNGATPCRGVSTTPQWRRFIP